MALAGALYPLCIPQRHSHLPLGRHSLGEKPGQALAKDAAAPACRRRRLTRAPSCASKNAVADIAATTSRDGGGMDCTSHVAGTSQLSRDMGQILCAGVTAVPACLPLAFPDSSLAATILQEASGTIDAAAGPVMQLAGIDSGTAQILAAILAPILGGLPILFVLRIVMSWYPQLPVREFPYIVVYAPTEPVLGPTRKLLPPIGGVDVAPVIWLFLVTFINEILLGQQGLLILLSQKV